MPKYKTINGEFRIPMVGKERTQISDEIKFNIKGVIVDFLKKDENLETLVEEGYISHESSIEYDRDIHVGKIRLNIITDDELRRLYHLEKEVERYRKIREERTMAFFEKLKKEKDNEKKRT